MQMPDPDSRVLSRKAQIVERLRAVLPDAAVISDPVETRAYECDALAAYRCPPLAVSCPRPTQGGRRKRLRCAIPKACPSWSRRGPAPRLPWRAAHRTTGESNLRHRAYPEERAAYPESHHPGAKRPQPNLSHRASKGERFFYAPTSPQLNSAIAAISR